MKRGRPGKTSVKYAPDARPAVARGIPKPVVDVLINLAGPEEHELTLDATLMGDLGLDELDVIEFVMELESIYHIEIDDAITEAWMTVPLGRVLEDLRNLGVTF